MNDEEYLLLKRLRNGEVEVLDLLYMRYAGRIKEFACRLLRNRTEAEDLTHDIFVKLWEHRTELDKVMSLDGYLFRMTRNAVLDRIQRRSTRMRYESAVTRQFGADKTPSPTISHADHPETIVSTAELAELIDIAVSNMSERRRQIFLMSRHEHKSYEEIAAELQISPKTVQYHISEALNELRKMIAI